MINPPSSCKNCKNAFCRSLSSAARTDIFMAKNWFTYNEKQEQLFFFENNQLLIIESGNFMTIRHDAQGKQQGIDILKSGDLLGIVNLYNDNTHDAISFLPFTVIYGCMLPIQIFESLCEKHPSLAKATIKQMSNRFYRLIRHMSNQAFGNSLDKIEFSLELSKRHLGNFYLTHEQIAILSGLNRVTVTKAMPKISR